MKRIYIIVVLILVGQYGFSQKDCPRYSEKREKIEAEKISFITSKLNLSVEEAQKFWPLYNEYQKKRESNFAKTRKLKHYLFKNSETMTDAKIVESLNKINELELAEVRLIKQYDDKYLKILSAQKVVLLHVSEREFKKTLLHKLKQCQPPK